MKTSIFFIIIYTIMLLSCFNNNIDTLDDKNDSQLKLNILVPTELSAFDIKAEIEVFYNYPNSTIYDKIGLNAVYECNNRDESNQFIETIVPELYPGFNVTIVVTMLKYVGASTFVECNYNNSSWEIQCKAIKNNVTIIADQLTRVNMTFICSDNGNDYGDVEINVDDIFYVKKIVGAVYKLPIGSTNFTSGSAVSNAIITISESTNSCPIGLLSPTNGIITDIHGTFSAKFLLNQTMFTLGNPTLYVQAEKISELLYGFQPVLISTYSNPCTLIMLKIPITPSTIAATGNVGTYSSMDVDSNNNLHISYYDQSNDRLKYISKINNVWTTSTTIATNSGEYNSLAVDRNGKVHISYYRSSGNDLMYANNINGSWQTQTLDSIGNVGQYTSIAVDSNNYPHISYYDNTNNDLKYTYFTGLSWITQSVDTIGNVGQYSSLKLQNDKPIISYYKATGKDLKFADYRAGSWIISNVDTVGNVGEYTSLALDTNGNPTISYYDNSNNSLKYAKYNGSNWQVSVVDSNNNVGQYTCLKYFNNIPYISYYDVQNKDLKLAVLESNVWKTNTLDSNGQVGSYDSMVIDSLGHIHIVYYDDAGNKNLKYIYLP